MALFFHCQLTSTTLKYEGVDERVEWNFRCQSFSLLTDLKATNAVMTNDICSTLLS